MKGPARWVALAVVVVLGFALRLNLSLKAFFSSFDTSTVGLMGLHILEGERPLFYYGQDYMGSLEAYVAALMFALFGISTTSLSLSPILFALGWIVAMYLLFAELFDIPAGIAASLCTAATGWYPLWFSMASNGGYPETFFFGTLFLYLAVRLVGRELSPGREWTHAVGLGAAAALGVWTNFQVFSYVVTGALILLGGVVWRRGKRAFTMKVAAAGLIGLLGFIPLLVTTWGSNSKAGEAGPSIRLLPENAVSFLKRLPKLFLWPIEVPALLLAVSLAAFTAALLFYFIKVLSGTDGRERLRGLVPLLFASVFLSLYLVHPAARLNAPRYLTPLISMTTAAAFGAAVSMSKKPMRYAGWALLALWTIYNVSSALETADARVTRKEAHVRNRTEIIGRAEEAGLRHLMILGSAIDGLSGQSLTFYARDRVRFVSSTWERYHPAAESAELDPATGFLVKKSHRRRVRRSLVAVGIPSFQEEVFGRIIIHDIDVPHVRRQSVPPAAMRVKIEGLPEEVRGESLLDRADETGVSPGPDRETAAVLTVTLERPVEIDGLWFTARNSRLIPRSFDISTSVDGVIYQPVRREFHNLLPTYISGNKAYMMGYHVRSDLRFGPAKARFVRIRIDSRRNDRSSWEVNEIFLFERLGEDQPVSDDEVESMARIISERKIDFTVADRWLSARLGALLDDREDSPPVYPRFNPRSRHTLVSRRFPPRKGLGVAIERAVADECESVLSGSLPAGARLERVNFPHYVLYTFVGPETVFESLPDSLTWNGHMVLRMEGGEQ